jgi:hypothetical protein
MVSVLAIGPKVCTRLRGMDFKGDKNPQHAFVRNGNIAVGPMSQDFAAYYRSLTSMKEILRDAQFIVPFASSPCFATR